jgi:hypothetical protein
MSLFYKNLLNDYMVAQLPDPKYNVSPIFFRTWEFLSNPTQERGLVHAVGSSPSV